MILSPAEYYDQRKGETRFMRDINGPFTEGVSKGQIKRMARCVVEGYVVCTSTLEACYPVIAANRADKGRSHAISMEDWKRLPSFCFAVVPGIIAAALCVKVRPDVIYVSAWGHLAPYSHLSPVVLLCSGIYRWCAANGIKTLDIGVADEPGLIEFKKRLGFTERVLT